MCVEATSMDDLTARLLVLRSAGLAEFPARMADYVDRNGWSFIEAEHELGEVLMASGVYDKILKALGLP